VKGVIPVRKLCVVLLATLAVPAMGQGDAHMQWWRDAKFGMFIHWGIYSIPARGEWVMYNEKIPVEKYEPFAKQFDPTGFNAGEWAKLAKSAGMKYVVITSKHHDGFSLFDSKLTDYKATNTPGGKDYLKLLSHACAKENLPLGFYYSLLDWHHPDYRGDFPAYLDYAFGQIRELCTGYGKLAVLWFDGGWEHSAADWKADDLVKMIRRSQPGIVINDRSGIPADYSTPEQTIPGRGMGSRPWETCMTINGSWGYNAGDQSYKSTDDLIRILVDVVSKGGNLLLNVGPRADGTIQPEFVERLKAVGEWLKANGESIYGTEGGPFAPQPWGRCTVKRVDKGRTYLYFHLFGIPESGTVEIRGLGSKVWRAWMLSTGQRVEFSQDGTSLRLAVPTEGRSPADTVIVVSTSREPRVEAMPVAPDGDGNLKLTADLAEVHGSSARVENSGANIGFWTDASDYVTWAAKLDKSGEYNVTISQACEPGTAGATYEVTIGNAKIAGIVKATGGWADYVDVPLGRLSLPAGTLTVTVRPLKMPGFAVMNLKELRLTP